MLNKKGYLEDWMQVIVVIIIIGVSFILFIGLRDRIKQENEHTAEQSLEGVEGGRILLEFLSSVDNDNKRAIDLLVVGMSSKDMSSFQKHAEKFFKNYFPDETTQTWKLEIEGSNAYDVHGSHYMSAGTKIKISSIKIAMPDNQIATVSLFLGKDIDLARAFP